MAANCLKTIPGDFKIPWKCSQKFNELERATLIISLDDGEHFQKTASVNLLFSVLTCKNFKICRIASMIPHVFEPVQYFHE